MKSRFVFGVCLVMVLVFSACTPQDRAFAHGFACTGDCPNCDRYTCPNRHSHARPNRNCHATSGDNTECLCGRLFDGSFCGYRQSF